MAQSQGINLRTWLPQAQGDDNPGLQKDSTLAQTGTFQNGIITILDWGLLASFWNRLAQSLQGYSLKID